MEMSIKQFALQIYSQIEIARLVTSVCTMGHRTAQTILYPSLWPEKQKRRRLTSLKICFKINIIYPEIGNNISSSIQSYKLIASDSDPISTETSYREKENTTTNLNRELRSIQIF